MTPKKALVLVNTGTPDKPTVSAVRRFLFQFLNDKRVIDIPNLLRWLLVNLIIVPFRAPKSTRLYQKLWTKDGSPLLFHLNNLAPKVQQILGNSHDVYPAMRYGNPSLKQLLNELSEKQYEEVVIFPLFPQFATSTTESIADVVNNSYLAAPNAPQVSFVRQFYDNPLFFAAYENRISAFKPEEYDYVLFSYHGLPLRQVDKMHPGVKTETCPCKEALPAHGEYCYKATCYHTTHLLADALQLPTEKYETTFQSRLSKNWLRPFTDETIVDLANKGVKNLLVVAPAFVADCLETTIEIGWEYNELFQKCGGNQLTLVPSLNDMDEWAAAIAHISTSNKGN
jgi:ferrochelatase